MKIIGFGLLIVLAVVVVLFLGGLIVARVQSPAATDVPHGVVDRSLVPCPETPNCVSTFAEDELHRVEAIELPGTQAALIARAQRALLSLPRTRIREEAEDYLRAESRSLVFRYVDDVEVYVPPEGGVIHFRSASRVGRGDLNVNRRRYQRFRDEITGGASAGAP